MWDALAIPEIDPIVLRHGIRTVDVQILLYKIYLLAAWFSPSGSFTQV